MKSTSDRGVKETLKPCAYKRSEPLRMVTACLCIMNLRVAVGGEAKRLGRGAGAKASPNRAYSRRRQTRNRVIYAWAG